MNQRLIDDLASVPPGWERSRRLRVRYSTIGVLLAQCPEVEWRDVEYPGQDEDEPLELLEPHIDGVRVDPHRAVERLGLERDLLHRIEHLPPRLAAEVLRKGRSVH